MTRIFMEVHHTRGRFFLAISDKEAELLYTMHGSKMDITHTCTPPELRGRSIAEQLTLAAFRHAKQEGLRVIPTCPYISETFLKKHPELNDIVEF